MNKVAVVTVVLNDVEGIVKTIESVLSQDDTKYEYIILDGMSTDGTFDVAQGYKNKFENIGVRYCVYTEKDDGVYDAMNKSLRYVEAEYIIFMNSGDSFATSTVLSTIEPHLDGKNDIVYGNTIFEKGKWERLQIADNFEGIVNYIPFCHQSVFTKTELMRECGFDLKYKISSDYNFFLKMYLDGKFFKKTNIIISRFVIGGISFTEMGKVEQLERIIVKYDNGLISDGDMLVQRRRIERNYLINKIKVTIKKVIPQIVINFLLDVKYSMNGWVNNGNR